MNNFDLLRIFAASQVMFSHAFHHLRVDMPAGWWIVEAFPGVPIFFAISGFLISASFERNPDLGGYFRNRILRIFPGLWACVFLTVAVVSLFGEMVFDLKALIWLLAQLFGVIYTPGFLKDFGIGSYNGSLWTIPVELQFYILTPLFYWAFRKTGSRSLFVVLVLLFFIGIGFATWAAPVADHARDPILNKLIRYSFLPHFYMFMAGLALRHFCAHESKLIAGKAVLWTVGYLTLHALLPSVAGSKVVLSLLLCVTTVSWAYTLPTLAQRVLKGNDISYGVYIYHGLILNVFVALGLYGGWPFIALLVLFGYLAGSASWAFVERPFMGMRKRTAARALAGRGGVMNEPPASASVALAKSRSR